MAVLGALLLAVRGVGVPPSRWGWPQWLDLLAVPLGVGGALYLLRPAAPRARLAETLEVVPGGIELRFANGALERLAWADPRLDLSLAEMTGIWLPDSRPMFALYVEGWRSPALLTAEAKARVVAEAERHGLRAGSLEEDTAKGRRSTLQFRAPPGP